MALLSPDWPINVHAKFFHYLAIIHLLDGDLLATQHSATESLRLARNNRQWTTINQARIFLGITHYLLNEVSEAKSYFLDLIENLAFTPPSHLAHATFALARIYLIQGQSEKANEALHLGRSHLKEKGNPLILQVIRAFQVELALEQGDLALARSLSSTVDLDARLPLWFYYVPQLTIIKLMLAEGTTKSLSEALASLEQLDEYVNRINRITMRIDVLVMQALVHDAQGDWEIANEKLSAALRWVILAGIITYAGVLLGQQFGDWQGSFLGALLLGFYTSLVSLQRHLPSSVVMLPGIMILVPGVAAYFGVDTLQTNSIISALSAVWGIIVQIVAILGGLYVAASLMPRQTSTL